ncbi:hypothetical protein Tco_1130867 [Tanacetum coccineum]
MEWGTGVFDVVDWGDEWADEVEGCMILGCCWAWLVLEVGWLTVDEFGVVKSLSCIGDGVSLCSRKLYEGGFEGVIEPKGKMVSSKFT